MKTNRPAALTTTTEDSMSSLSRADAVSIIDSATGGIYCIAELELCDGAWGATIIDPASGDVLGTASVESDACEPWIDWA